MDILSKVSKPKCGFFTKNRMIQLGYWMVSHDTTPLITYKSEGANVKVRRQ